MTGTSLPSYFRALLPSIFDSSALSPFADSFTPPSDASRTIVRLVIGDCPDGGLDDFSVFIFQVPSVLSAANAIEVIARIANATIRLLFVRITFFQAD